VTTDKSIVFKFANVEVREREFCLVKASEEFSVEPKTFRVLLYLLRNPQKLIPKDELLNAVWGDAVATDSSLTRTIAQLRKLLGDEIRNPRYIETVATVGYRFLCPVEVSEDNSGLLEATAEQNGVIEGDFVGMSPLGGAREGAADTDAKVKGVAAVETTPIEALDARTWRFRGRNWLLVGAAALVAGLAIAAWYIRRPLPPPRISDYVQITHDGHRRDLGGTDGNRLYFTQFSPRRVSSVRSTQRAENPYRSRLQCRDSPI
jgi:DNA-binding winged helix-turn-helix (wHTH) protein